MPEQPGRSRVAVEYSGQDARVAVRRALEAVNWTRTVPAGAGVFLKVNLGWDLFIPGSITCAPTVPVDAPASREQESRWPDRAG